jgi:predicted nucleotidyltransferase
MRLKKKEKENLMKRSEVLAFVRSHQVELQKLGVKSLDLFGSIPLD